MKLIDLLNVTSACCKLEVVFYIDKIDCKSTGTVDWWKKNGTLLHNEEISYISTNNDNIYVALKKGFKISLEKVLT